MKRALLMILLVLGAVASLAQAMVFPIPDDSAEAAFADRKGTLVVIDCASGAMSIFHPEMSAEKLPPCSTFKIWNTLIGLECGLIASPEEAFYAWDGNVRSIPAWNRDLTLQEAFQASCVPAFQALARKIGDERMRSWLEKVGYGDRDTSSGVDVFWLPATGRKTLLISPAEQARLMGRLVTGKLPFSEQSQAVLKRMMLVQKTDRGALYGKTGSGTDAAGIFNLGWFVGYVESDGRTFAFACVVTEAGLTGKDARAIVEAILGQNGYL
jgi:beta-lactamase class D